MPNSVRFRCKSCGFSFDAEILSRDEQHEARRRSRPLLPVRCPRCKSADIEA